jgi:hypothetical protein
MAMKIILFNSCCIIIYYSIDGSKMITNYAVFLRSK